MPRFDRNPSRERINGIVSAPSGRPSITCSEDLFYLSGREVCTKRRQFPSSNARNSAREILVDRPVVLEIPYKGTQRAAHELADRGL